MKLNSLVMDPHIAVIAARAILSEQEMVSDPTCLRAIGYAAFYAAKPKAEIEILRGMHKAAQDAGETDFATALGAAIEALE
jgi:hypothetical protein